MTSDDFFECALFLQARVVSQTDASASTSSQGKLPIDLLFESSEVEDRESVEYVGTVFRLLQAYPETPGHIVRR